jgi:hypothetical protein
VLFYLKNLLGYPLQVKEGPIGKTEQCYFDDSKWVIRYIIVNTGQLFKRKKVLISPLSIQTIDHSNQVIVANLTRDQLEHSPDIDTEKPLSRQMEIQYLDHYRWAYYWTGAGIWGSGSILEEGVEIPSSKNKDHDDIHLRSTSEVFGYHVDATDSECGRVDDFIVDQTSWKIRYLVVHLKKWLPSKVVLISIDWVEYISWRQRKIRVLMSRDEIEKSPSVNPKIPMTRSEEDLLHTHYGREKYWENKNG